MFSSASIPNACFRHGMWVLVISVMWGTPCHAAGTHGVPFADRSLAGKSLLLLGSTAASVVYTPVKALYAVGGTVAGGMVFLMSAGQSTTAAGEIIQRTTRGDWFIHPDHLTGNRKLRFKGIQPRYPNNY